MIKTPTIICVDDDKTILFVLKHQLQKYFKDSFDIEIAHSAEEAWELINYLISNNTSLPLIITDEMMPGMKGHELIERVEQIAPKTKSILLTGYASSDILDDLNNRGLTVLSKPWDQSNLLNEVAKSINFIQK